MVPSAIGSYHMVPAAITFKVITDLLMLCAHVEQLILNIDVEYLKTILVIRKIFLKQGYLTFLE